MPRPMSIWFKKYRHDAAARMRLFCFPYAGGNARIFAEWEKSLPGWLDVFALQPPGRTVRFTEPPISNLRTKLSILVNEIRPYLDVPYVFMGHSAGALTAFELARELQSRGGTPLRHIILSAKRAPHIPRRETIHNLPFQQFVARLRKLEATPEELLADEELMRIYEPMLRADFSLTETHDFTGHPRLRGPATLFWGETDADVPKEDMLAWREHVDGEVELVAFPGGHFFIHTHSHEVIARVREIVEQAVE